MGCALELGPRLAAVAAMVPPASRVADVGSDHGKLPTFLLASGQATSAFALDVANGPILTLRQGPLATGLVVRQGDGLAPMLADEVDVVTICGMGGHTMARVVAQAPAPVWAGLRCGVFQPNDHAAEVRRALLARGWGLGPSTIVWDRGRWYAVLVGLPPTAGGARGPFTDAELAWGPGLIARRDPVLASVLRNKVQRLTAVVAGQPGAVRAQQQLDRCQALLALPGWPGSSAALG